MPNNDILEAKKVWEKAIKVINDRVELKLVNKRVENNLPKSIENMVSHVRPHVSNAVYKFNGFEVGDLKNANQLPNGDWMTTQCFWLNKKNIAEIIKNEL